MSLDTHSSGSLSSGNQSSDNSSDRQESKKQSSDNCSCACERQHFKLNVNPTLRFRCHCSICQEVYKAPYADFVVVPAAAVESPKGDVRYQKMRRPPNLQRGTCPSCERPVIASMTLVPGLSFMFIPVANLNDNFNLPEPKADIFYHRRQSDLDDAIPKYQGYWPSEWAVSKAILGNMLKGR